MTTATKNEMYQVVDSPSDGTAGQNCGTFALADLPQRLLDAVLADPTASEWRLPALSDGDSGHELSDLTTIIRRA